MEEFTGGNPEIEQSLAKMYNDNPTIAIQEKQVELDADVFSFVSRAMSSDSGNIASSRRIRLYAPWGVTDWPYAAGRRDANLRLLGLRRLVPG